MAREELISVEEALKLVLDGIDVLPEEHVPLQDGLGRILAKPIVSNDNLPPFDNSAMDGYAVRAANTKGASPNSPAILKVLGDIAAGTSANFQLTSGTAARIMTGAPIPFGADAVVPVENTSEPWRDSSRPLTTSIEIFRAVGSGAYVREAGGDVTAGNEVLRKGHLLRPQELGLLASLGIGTVPVVRKPKIAVLSTGDELIGVDEELRPGKIRNSNSHVQLGQIRELGAEAISLGVAKDDEGDVRRRLQIGLDQGVDLFISSAGVSVGAYDVVKSVLEKPKGAICFWRVRMRPGKPLIFGKYRRIPFLGLPGNPVSAMVSFERFARPAILSMAGHSRLERPRVKVTLLDDIESDGRESYVRVRVSKDANGYSAVIMGRQGSHMITSLVMANALVVVPEGILQVRKGDKLSALMLDWPETVF